MDSRCIDLIAKACTGRRNSWRDIELNQDEVLTKNRTIYYCECAHTKENLFKDATIVPDTPVGIVKTFTAAQYPCAE
jgi:hypothetical protein